MLHDAAEMLVVEDSVGRLFVLVVVVSSLLSGTFFADSEVCSVLFYPELAKP